MRIYNRGGGRGRACDPRGLDVVEAVLGLSGVERREEDEASKGV